MVIWDAKYCGSIEANKQNVQEAFSVIGADAVTVDPYPGGDTLEPFFAQKDKGIFVLCHTSNPKAYEFQELSVPLPGSPIRIPLYQCIARSVANEWNVNDNCGLVVGATYPRELAIIRRYVGENMPILSPGGGHYQGGDIEAAVKAGTDKEGYGLALPFSRQIMFAGGGQDYASDAGREILRLQNLTNEYRNRECPTLTEF
jgi:orotidine-5'-phosphate decarboxylase